jgi:colicin import membrane protein
MRPRPLRPAPEWDDRFSRMVVVSAVAHAALIVVAVWVLARRGAERPLPLMAYTVEITDPNALGGRLPPGAPGKPLTGGPTAPPAPPPRVEPAAPKAEEPKAPEPPEQKPPAEEAKPPEPTPAEAKPSEPKPPEPKPEEAAVRVEEKPKPPEPKPEPKKVEPPAPPPPPQAAKPEPPKPQPRPEPKKPEPPKPAAANPEPPKPPPAKPDAQAAAAGRQPTPAAAAAADDYAAAAERWRTRSEKQAGGLGGTDAGSGPIGAGGQGPGGGGQLVGIEFLAYRQQVINTVKAQWTNVIARPGLVTIVRFEIAPDGAVTGIRVERSSGNPAYDASAMRAVQRANPLPPPPARYAREFGEFLIEFHSEEQGGQGAG